MDTGTVNGQATIFHSTAGGMAFPDGDGSYGGAGISSYFPWVGTTAIIDIAIAAVPAIPLGVISIVDDRRIVDNGGIMDDRDIPGLIHIIVADLGAADILMRHKRPVADP